MQPNFNDFSDYTPLERGSARQLTTPNYLSPTNFRVIIPRLPKMTHFIQSVSVPSIAITSMDIAYKAFPRTSIPSSLDISDQVVINYIIDENMENWQEIYNWMTSITSNSENEGVTAADLYSEIIVLVYNSAKKLKKKITYTRAHPVSLMSFEFNSANADIDPILLSCNFAYKTIEIVDYT